MNMINFSFLEYSSNLHFFCHFNLYIPKHACTKLFPTFTSSLNNRKHVCRMKKGKYENMGLPSAIIIETRFKPGKLIFSEMHKSHNVSTNQKLQVKLCFWQINRSQLKFGAGFRRCAALCIFPENENTKNSMQFSIANDKRFESVSNSISTT